MAAPITDTTDLFGPVNVIFQTTLLRTAMALCPYFAGTVPAQVTQHQGSFTASWRRIENLAPTITPLGELTGDVAFPTRDSIVPTVTQVTSTVLKYGQYILLNEDTDLVNFSGQTDDLVKKLGISSGRSLNMLQRNEIEDNSPITWADGAANDAATDSPILGSDIDNVVNLLARNDAITFMADSTGSQNVGTQPILPGYIGICHPDVAYDIAKIAGFKSVETYAGQVSTMTGEFGIYAGAGYSVRFVQSSDASVEADAGSATVPPAMRGNTGVDLYPTVIYGEDAVGSLGFGMTHTKEIYTAGDKLPAVVAISHGRGTSGAADPLNELGTLGWKSWHGAQILTPIWTNTIRSGATLLG